MAFIHLETSLGKLYITAKDGFISNIGNTPQKEDVFCENNLLIQAKQQINEYFEGQRMSFNLPLNPCGTVFQKLVWQNMLAIPYSQTISYGDISKKINSSPRAVGLACGKNPIPIIIPCHRVIGKNGQLGGYSGFNGVKDKEFLLNLEASFY